MLSRQPTCMHLPMMTHYLFLLEKTLLPHAICQMASQIQVLNDTGSHKNIMNKLFFKKHASHFQNFTFIPITTPPHIKTPTGQTVTIEGMIALPIYLQGNLFQLHILLATFSDQYELILGIEALIQLEATLFLADSTLQVTR